MIFDVYNPIVTTGTWGWTDRPKAFFNFPLLGEVHILKLENRLVGKALLLDEKMNVNCSYLYEARGAPVPDGEQISYVRWSIESTVEEGSKVTCEG